MRDGNNVWDAADGDGDNEGGVGVEFDPIFGGNDAGLLARVDEGMADGFPLAEWTC